MRSVLAVMAVGVLAQAPNETAFLGIALGLLIAGASAHLIESLLFEIAPLDALTFVCIPVLFFSVAVAAALASARRATTIRPAEALKAE